jgi:ABC-type glycerol-3-phosphate transport system permease component
VSFARFFANRLLIAAGATAGDVASCTLAAYAFARLRFPGRRLWFALMIGTLLPLSRPALVTAAIFSFIWTWNDFFTQIVYLNDLSPLHRAGGAAAVPGLDRPVGDRADVRHVRPVAAADLPVLPGLPAPADRRHQHHRA